MDNVHHYRWNQILYDFPIGNGASSVWKKGSFVLGSILCSVLFHTVICFSLIHEL